MKKNALATCWVILTLGLLLTGRFAAAQDPAAGAQPEDLPVVEALPADVSEPLEPRVSLPDPSTEASTDTVELVELVTERETPPVDVTQGERITITLDGVPIQDVIRMFTRISGANIVSGKELAGKVTVSLKDVEWEPALRIILDSVDLALVEKSPGIYSVLSKADLALEPLTIETFTLQFQTVSSLLPVIQSMLISSNASASGAAGVNIIIIRETAEQIGKIREIVSRIDKARPQVFIEAKFVELNDQAIKDLGINWQALQSYSIGAGGLKWTLGDARERKKYEKDSLYRSDNFLQKDADQKTYDMFGVLATGGRTVDDSISREQTYTRYITDTYTRNIIDGRAAVLSASDFALVLSALKQNSGVSVVSNPKIVVASGEKATIRVGSRRPNISASVTAQSEGVPYFVYTLVDWIEIGIDVTVAPVVNNESNITVRIVPQLTRAPVADDVIIPQTGQSFPRPTISKVDTEFNIENNRTVAIGGLSLSDDQEKVIKVPVLGDIPLIGKYLFRHTKTEKTQSEIIIFVTVALANPDTMFERTGIPSEGQLIHRHLTSREAPPVSVGNGNKKTGGKK